MSKRSPVAIFLAASTLLASAAISNDLNAGERKFGGLKEWNTDQGIEEESKLDKDAKIKPNLRPILLMICAARAAKTAVPTTVNAVGNVASDFIEAICDPIIPLKKTVIVAAVNPKTWLKVNKVRFLFINKLN